MRRGGLPVVNPFGETFPPGFVGQGDYTSAVSKRCVIVIVPYG